MAFGYDALNRLTKETLPSGQSETFAYDAVGDQIQQTDYNNATTTFAYDSMNRLTEESYSDGSVVTFTYTSTGQRQAVVDSRGTTSYSYDARDRLIERTDPDGQTVKYTYDPAGNETSLTVASGRTSYTYDALDRMVTVSDPQGGETHYGYDPAGNLVSTEISDGTVETRQYDALNRLVSIETVGPGGGVISGFRYTLGPTGFENSVTEDGDRSVTYSYDGDDRLTEESIIDPTGGNRSITYTYDAVGNRLTEGDSAQGLTTYTYDEDNRLLTQTSGGQVTEYTYDADGNMLSMVTGTTDKVSYTWDFQDRLVTTDITDSTGTHHVTYQYDADGNRVAETQDGVETRFLLDTNRPLAQVLEEYTPAGRVQAAYIYGTGLILMDRGGTLSYYHTDALGSVRALTDAAGKVTDRYTYDAFGLLIDRTGDTPNPYQFAGQWYDEAVGLDYLRARYADPSIGRFISADPFDGSLSDPFSLHKYLYANADPVNATDPSGRQTSLAELNVAGAIQVSLESLNTAAGYVRFIGTVKAYAKVIIPLTFLAIEFSSVLAQHGFRAGFQVDLTPPQFPDPKDNLIQKFNVRLFADGPGELRLSVNVQTPDGRGGIDAVVQPASRFLRTLRINGGRNYTLLTFSFAGVEALKVDWALRVEARRGADVRGSLGWDITLFGVGKASLGLVQVSRNGITFPFLGGNGGGGG
jgi:RHS repeat-associated protein